MAFIRALYYPTIDITNEDWLKTAVLFWDEINMIVPESINNPYRKISTQYLSDEGILKPLRVHSDMDTIEELTADTLNYLNTNEGFQLLTQSQGNTWIHMDKMPREIREIGRIHPEKLPYAIRHQLERSFDNDGWLHTHSSFAIFYMTLLANKLCNDNSISLLTDNIYSSNLADKAKLDNQIFLSDDYEYHRHRHNNKHINIGQGLLTNLIIESISIKPNTSLEDVVQFKRRYSDELGLFRTNIAKLTQQVSTDKSIEAVKQQVQDIYINEFLPAFNNFKKALSGLGIKWSADNFMKIAFFSTGTAAIPTALLGLSIPTAIMAGAGISLVSSAISYNIDKQRQLRENPYSYLLSINEYLG
ncbi:hypothetical protein FACS189427_09350 [Planctomycetales bacterium]|nr:hypothetical protein FACS189427_09350 [Planctomycetales bacterium]